MTTKISSLILKIYQSKQRGQMRIFMIKIMIRETDTGQIVEIWEYHSVVGYNMDRITETDQGIIRTIEVILGEEV